MLLTEQRCGTTDHHVRANSCARRFSVSPDLCHRHRVLLLGLPNDLRWWRTVRFFLSTLPFNQLRRLIQLLSSLASLLLVVQTSEVLSWMWGPQVVSVRLFRDSAC